MSTLRGIILREDADTLVVQASPEDIAQFGASRNSDVDLRLLNGGSASMTMEAAMAILNERKSIIYPGDSIYRRNGQAICRITDVRVSHIDVTPLGQEYRQFIARGRQIVLHLTGEI